MLNGSKHFISDGVWSDFFLVSAKTGEKEITMLMVDKGLPGLTVGKDQKMMGIRGVICSTALTSFFTAPCCLQRPAGLVRGQTVLYLTERARFRLTAEGIELFEIAPGIDLQRDVLDQMAFAPLVVADLKVMDSAYFQTVAD